MHVGFLGHYECLLWYVDCEIVLSFRPSIVAQCREVGLNRELPARPEANDASKTVVLDMDGTESPVYGQQGGR